MEIYYSLLSVIALIVLNATFVAAEFAIARVRKTKIDYIAEASNKDEFTKTEITTAQLLKRILSNINDYISACQVGITISSLALGAIAEAKIEELISAMIGAHEILGLNVHGISIVLAIGVITFFHVILGEVVPKNIALLEPEKVAFGLAYFLRFLYLIFKFPVMVLNTCSTLILRLLRIETNLYDAAHSEEEIKIILSSSQAQGVLEEEEEQLIQNIFEFNDTIARNIMVPRADMVCINSEMTIEAAGNIIKRTSFARFPVFKDRMDNIIGYFSIKDVLKAYQEGRIKENIKTVMVDVLKVSDGMYVIDLLKLMQEKKKQIAILIDEFGGVAGLVTAEDIVEELFGEISDEGEKHLEIEKIQKIDDNQYIIDGLTNIDEINEDIGTDFESDHHDTIGGLVFGLIGTLPKAGDKVELDKYTLLVERLEKNRIKFLRLFIKEPELVPEAESP